MLKQRDFIFLFVFIAALLNESNACFRNNQHQKTVLTTGSSYYKECQCTEPGFTINNLKWLDIHDQPIETGPGTNKVLYTEETQDSINLFIPSISKSMSGKYKCVTEVSGVKYVQSYTIDAYDPLYFFKTPIDQHLTIKKDSTIVCEARGESLPRISWQKKIDEEFVDILPIAERYEIKPKGLVVKNVTKEDAGTYKCTALVMSTGEEVDKFIDVDVQTVPVIKNLQAYPESIVVVGESLTIDCIAEGIPTPQYAWKKIVTDSNKTETWKQKVNTISFDSIVLDDEGIYECHAYNEAGSSKRLINVEVLVPPVVTYFPNITDVEGTTIQLVCNATGKPEPNITIIYEGWDIRSDWELSNYENVPNKAFATLERSSEGIYVCNASNEVGYDMVSIYLTVLHRPYFKEPNNMVEWGYDGKIVKLSCTHDSNPPADISWRFENNDIPTEQQVEIIKSLIDHANDKREPYLTLNIDKNFTYGTYACTAKNEIGEATKFFFLKEGFRPPAIKTEINITDLTATAVTFRIEAQLKDDNIPDILGYTAQYDEESNYYITDIHPNRTWSLDWPYKIEKLKPNSTYYVSFAAVNEVGVGEFSNQIDFTTLEKSVPESPVLEEESLQRSANGNHLLKWKESEDNGEPIDFYVLKYCSEPDESGDRLCEVRHVAPTTEMELVLESNTTYYFELIAHNAEGNSTAANISITSPALQEEEPTTFLSGGAIIGISIIIVLVCLFLLDLLLLVWRRQGIIAACSLKKKDKKKKEDAMNTRDKKGLLIVEPIDTRPDNGHREYEYNKNTGIVTGKHSSV